MPSDFAREQGRVAVSMGAGVVVTACALLLLWFANPLGAPRLDSAVSRVVYAASIEPFVLVQLAADVVNVARQRFVSPADIAGGGLPPCFSSR